MKTYGLISCISPDGWSLHAPGVSDEQIADGDAAYLNSGEGEPTAADYAEAAQIAAERAAKRMNASWDRSRQVCTFRDPASGKDFVCNNIDNMLRLCALQESTETTSHAQAYDLWFAECMADPATNA